MMECKKALTEADGDMVKAEELLRVKLGTKAGKAASRITAEGVLIIKSQEHRSQEMNKAEAIRRLHELVDSVARAPRIRRATQPTRAS